MFQWIPQEAWDSDVVFKEVGQAKDMHIVYNNNESERIELPDYCMITLIDLSVEGSACSASERREYLAANYPTEERQPSAFTDDCLQRYPMIGWLMRSTCVL